ncbi:MAG: TIGR00730 family Rossman fold protein [Bacteriovoracaceae bacterium]|mgnify:CR=1 FL=1|nr:TIGR00730 family Rossman fold protein [Bacteriovoracaceae bacterium]
MNYLCVFCGSASGKKDKFTEVALNLGQEMSNKNIGLVYGGASIGVMGAVADGVLRSAGEVIGVIPQAIVDLEVSHKNLTHLHIVDSMHTRKEKMYQLSNGFVALPGGMGTLDELCEIVTWAQLKFHTKPIYVLNQDGFYDHLMAHFRSICENGFLKKEHLDFVREVKTVQELLDDYSSVI